MDGLNRYHRFEMIQLLFQTEQTQDRNGKQSPDWSCVIYAANPRLHLPQRTLSQFRSLYIQEECLHEDSQLRFHEYRQRLSG